jgi:hypothetical protein
MTDLERYAELAKLNDGVAHLLRRAIRYCRDDRTAMHYADEARWYAEQARVFRNLSVGTFEGVGDEPAEAHTARHPA